MKSLIAFFTALFITQASYANVDISKKIDRLDLAYLGIIADNTLKVSVQVDDANLPKPYIWEMVPADIAILYKHLENVEKVKEEYTDLMITNPSQSYKGLLITITNKYGEDLKPFRIFKGDITHEDGSHIAEDINRNLEYLIWGMNQSNYNRSLTWQMMPITSFKDCMKLGNVVVETSPRQCLLSNGDIFLHVNELPSQESLDIKTFDECLVNGQALINTFPRRCIAAGGHVFAEPARIK